MFRLNAMLKVLGVALLGTIKVQLIDESSITLSEPYPSVLSLMLNSMIFEVSSMIRVLLESLVYRKVFRVLGPKLADSMRDIITWSFLSLAGIGSLFVPIRMFPLAVSLLPLVQPHRQPRLANTV